MNTRPLAPPCACGRPHMARGLCSRCYDRRRYAALSSLAAPAFPPARPAPGLPLCECCRSRLAVGPLTAVCSPCYTDYSARIAKRSGLKASAISHFETGRREPSLANLRRVRNALGASYDALLKDQ